MQRVRRGWMTPYKYLADSTQRRLLLAAGVPDRGKNTPIYTGREEWHALIGSLRRGDEAVVAELRIFGSRKAVASALADVEGRGAKLVSAVRNVVIDGPTLREAYDTERRWAGERSIGTRKRAKAMSAKALAKRREQIKASRMPEEQAEAKWRDIETYPTREAAAAAMGPGWSKMIAWRAFGPREKT
jgi:hypothetical protein